MSPREAVERSIVAFEGVESDHPADRGKLTRFGLTFQVFLEERPGGTLAQFKALSRDDVVDIITERFALKPGYWRIADQWVMWAVIDFAIHSGPRTATRELQLALRIEADGVFGPQTTRACNSTNPEQLFRRLIARRVRFLGNIIRRDHNQAAFSGGWFSRVAAILEAAA